MTTALTIVSDFCAAWDRLDWDAIHAALADDIVYHNIPMAPCHGLDEFKAFFAPFPLTAAKFDIHNITASGDVVMTERTDHLHMGDHAIVLRVMGVFEVRDGKIKAWRDQGADPIVSCPVMLWSRQMARSGFAGGAAPRQNAATLPFADSKAPEGRARAPRPCGECREARRGARFAWTRLKGAPLRSLTRAGALWRVPGHETIGSAPYFDMAEFTRQMPTG